jgi:RsiW-degrading membrane proteinase PrsW (M82 family)
MQKPPEQRNDDVKEQQKVEDGKKDQFEYVAAEIRRQHDVVTKIDDSLDTKIGIILGFTFLVLSQIAFRPELFGLAAKNMPLFLVFLCSLVIVFLAIIMGIKGLFFVRDYAIGPEIADLIDEHKTGADLNQVISRGISNAITFDRERGFSKAKWLKSMLATLIIGLAIFGVLEMLIYSSILRL